MPRGGGSRGGRSHGFHRSRIRHHRYHHRSGVGGANPLQLEQLGVAFGVFLIVAVIIVLFTSKDTGHQFFSPGDSRLVNFSANCRHFTLNDNSVKTAASLYLVTEEPPLTRRNTFNVASIPLTVGGSRYEYWQYHLYPRSNFSLSACSPNGGAAEFYVIKGSRKFRQWVKGRKVPNEHYVYVSNSCSGKHEFQYTSAEEDEYFFVFYNQGSTSVNINAHMSFERWEYSSLTTHADTLMCFVPPAGACSLEIPASAKHRALIVTDIPENVDWEENVDLSWSCDSYASDYLYLVPSKIPIKGLIVGAVVVLLATYFLWRRTIHEGSSTTTSLDPSVTSDSISSRVD